MKVIFIDIDGPLIPGRALFLPSNISKSQWTFDPCAVGMLNFLFWALPDLHAVISSHRVGFKSPYPEFSSTATLGFWQECFRRNCLNARFHSDWITPRGKNRSPKIIEIGAWLQNHDDVKTFAVLEDELKGYFSSGNITDDERKRFNLFAENYSEGLTYHCFRGVCDALGLHNWAFHKYYLEYETELA